MKRMTATLLIAFVVQGAAWADDTVQRAMEQDVVLRALVDELERGVTGLELEDLQRPYFIEYVLLDVASAWVSAELGAVTRKGQSRSRSLRTDVRVGSYELDNTNFGGGYYGGYGQSGGALPIEDDYNAIRQAIWWVTDRDYKNVAESFVQKKAFMESKMIEDKPDDFSRETPTVHLEERLDLSTNLALLEEIALVLSAIFRDYPDIQESSVNVSTGDGNKYLVNTEDTRLRVSGTRYAISVSANVQADDGMELSDSFSVYVLKREYLPSLDELSRRCREMIEQLITVKNAPMMEEAYNGPVLVDPGAAAELFSQHFAGHFVGGQRPVGSSTSPDDFANKLDRRILPHFLSVVDDPRQERIDDRPVLGHYLYDDQGIEAQPVSLVEEGRLKALLMSRNPSKEFTASNGHGRGFPHPRAAVGCLIVTADPAAGADQLKQELIEACQDEGLAYGVRIARFSGSNPLVMYKVYPDGREELVRGAEIARVDLRAFKRLLAAGGTPHVLNIAERPGIHTIVAPAMLFEELDLARIDRDFDKPPILPTPLARDRRD